MNLRVFTDGACTQNGKQGARASYACWFPDQPDWSVASTVPVDQAQTNQRGELLAIQTAVNVALARCGTPAETTLQIYTDSMYSKNCLTTWLPSWLKNDWKTSDGKPVSHRDIIEDVSMKLPRFQQYIFTHVRAHTGKQDELSRHNAEADRLAVQALHVPSSAPSTPKVVSTTTTLFPDLPLAMMGPPIEDKLLAKWCETHLHLLDPAAVKSALLMAFQKTIHKNGYDLEKQRLSKSTLIRLIARSQLIKESSVTITTT
jgi:ribonuclease HI